LPELLGFGLATLNLRAPAAHEGDEASEEFFSVVQVVSKPFDEGVSGKAREINEEPS
jgi:hypothetical protein